MYTHLFDGLSDNTRGYFARQYAWIFYKLRSIFLSPVGVGKNASNQIRDLLFHYLIFQLTFQYSHHLHARAERAHLQLNFVLFLTCQTGVLQCNTLTFFARSLAVLRLNEAMLM